MISTIAVVALGGAFGAVARYGVNISTVHIFGHGFPWSTLAVNILGSFLMGVLIAKFSTMDNVSHEIKALSVTGFLGAFTTFSTFAVESFFLIKNGLIMESLVYISLNLFGSIILAAAGYKSIEAIFG